MVSAFISYMCSYSLRPTQTYVRYACSPVAGCTTLQTGGYIYMTVIPVRVYQTNPIQDLLITLAVYPYSILARNPYRKIWTCGWRVFRCVDPQSGTLVLLSEVALRSAFCSPLCSRNAVVWRSSRTSLVPVRPRLPTASLQRMALASGKVPAWGL